jgi:hypothetical protein
MLRLLRIAIQVVLFFLLLGVVVALGDPNVGAVEKAAAVAMGVGLVWVAVPVRRLGAV